MAAKYSFICLWFTLLLTTDAKVVDSFEDCHKDEHFYQGIPPSINVNIPDNQLKRICQTHENEEHFATLYSTRDKIPIYSAYQVLCDGSVTGRSKNWYFEPQLNSQNNGPNINAFGRSRARFDNQAVVSDYTNTTYDKGHLNPNGYHCTKLRRDATFTLTNVVPQKPDFNQKSWHDLEETTLKSLKDECHFNGTKKFVVTGAVPSADVRIPQQIHRPDTPNAQYLDRVNVPSYMWTAICCDTSNAVNENERNRGWSYSYYGSNTDNPSPGVVSVGDLQNMLKDWYGAPGEPVIFARHDHVERCLFNEDSAGKVMKNALDAIKKYRQNGSDNGSWVDRAGRALIRGGIDYARQARDSITSSYHASRNYLRECAASAYQTCRNYLGK